MDEPAAEVVGGLVGPLLRALEMLAFVARHLHPPELDDLLASVGTPEDGLKVALARAPQWPQQLSGVRDALGAASEATISAFAGLREAQHEGGDIRAAYRALRHVAKGLEALYPLAGILEPVNRFFLDPSARADDALQQRFLQPPRDNTGVMHFPSEDGERGGFWLYVPEHYVPDSALPLVVALHGGSGTGRTFQWSWLRDARSSGAILAAPTSIQSTWALTGPDPDSPNLARIVDLIRSRWNVDGARLLLTGMSDGGTFSYVSGLEAGSPFTHLAPVSAAFHPLLAQMADANRIRELPIHIAHGCLDWMFPVEMARLARSALAAAGAEVTYREIDDLSHCYPREINAALLTWLQSTPSTAGVRE
jgi:phospholipase/carboxylesterase